ncbi:MAG: Gmad2 immunoglobulin-like domain-containing protein [Candidatus Uhrbacteria bacterium]
MNNIFLKVSVGFFVLSLFGFGCRPAGIFHGVPEQNTNPLPTNNSQVTTPPVTTPVVVGNISVDLPIPGSTIFNPIHVVGQARVFENVVSWRLQDSDSKIIANGTTYAAASDMGEYGPFDFWVVVPEVKNVKITLEVFQVSAKDGSAVDVVSIPLNLASLETNDLHLYFHNNVMDPEITCTTVYSVVRKIIATESPARAVMVMLLQGPTALETANHYSTAIPFRSELKDISLSKEGLATVDLSGAVTDPLGGSCLVSGIAAEIENTLKQFSSVKEVKILLDGKEDTLQP